jgi:hypothetical protein
MRKVTKYCFYLLGKFWHEKILPEHFKTSAYGRYNYKPRSHKHQARKKEKYGHSLPNVYTGIMRDKVLSRTNQDIRNTARGVKIVLHGPIYLYAYRKSYGQPDKAAELTAVDNRDRDLMVQFMQKHLRQEASKLTRGGTRSVRSGISG